MTTFEITTIALLAVIVVLLIVLLGIAIEGFHGMWQKLDANYETLSNIRGDTVDIFQELNDIADNIHDDLMDIRRTQELGKTSPNVPITPCYHPDGTCVNPHGDCINCPVRGGAAWSTSTNLNKED